MNKWDACGLLVLLFSLGYLAYALYPILSRPHPTNGKCYTIEPWRWQNTAPVWINHTGVPSGINWDADVQNAVGQWNSHTHFKLYTFTTNPTFAQVTVKFGPSWTLGLTQAYYSNNFAYKADITLQYPLSSGDERWSDSPGFLIPEYSVEHVLLHEFGHTTGLNHTTCTDDIMYATTPSGPARTTLGDGDIAGEQAIYGS